MSPNAGARRQLDPVGVLGPLAEFRRQIDEHRAVVAAAAAGPMIAELIRTAGGWAASDLEDELCVRVGRTLEELGGGPLDDHVDPDTFAAAALDASAAAVATALAWPGDGSAESPSDSWMAAWRVLVAVTDVLPSTMRDVTAIVVRDLRARPGGTVLPGLPPGPDLAGPPAWVRDAYGSRFGVLAPFRRGEGALRWYLWDIDACGFDVFTVHSRYHDTAEDALADWRDGVGSPAADGATFGPIEDPVLVAELLPRVPAGIRPGGEHAAHFAEFHRGRRLAEAVIDASPRARSPRPAAQVALDAPSAAVLFTAWLREHRPQRPASADLDDRVSELADSWVIEGPAALFATCSPHRVALTVDHIRDFYLDDFAADLVELLPDWAAWLCELNAIPAHLADRCRPYAHGDPHKAVIAENGRPDYFARIAE